MYSKNLQFGSFHTSKNKPENALILKQVHGKLITPLSEAQTEADGFVWKYQEQKSIVPCVYTADCLPILIEGKYGACILHAGWRGVQSQIYLRDIIDSISPVIALIGPSIQRSAFEVTSEFTNYFPNSDHFFQQNDKLFFDLQTEVKVNLLRKWKNLTIIDDQICTYKNEEYHSYRRTGKADRNYNFYILNKDKKKDFL